MKRRISFLQQVEILRYAQDDKKTGFAIASRITRRFRLPGRAVKQSGRRRRPPKSRKAMVGQAFSPGGAPASCRRQPELFGAETTAGACPLPPGLWEAGRGQGFVQAGWAQVHGHGKTPIDVTPNLSQSAKAFLLRIRSHLPRIKATRSSVEGRTAVSLSDRIPSASARLSWCRSTMRSSTVPLVTRR